MTNDFLLLSVAVLIATLIGLVFGVSATDSSRVKDCRAMGQFRVQEDGRQVVFECRQKGNP